MIHTVYDTHTIFSVYIKGRVGNASHLDNHPTSVMCNLMSRVGTGPTSMDLAKQYKSKGTHTAVPIHNSCKSRLHNVNTTEFLPQTCIHRCTHTCIRMHYICT